MSERCGGQSYHGQGYDKKTFEYWHWKVVSNKKENVLLQRAAAKIMRRQAVMAFDSWLEFLVVDV